VRNWSQAFAFKWVNLYCYTGEVRESLTAAAAAAAVRGIEYKPGAPVVGQLYNLRIQSTHRFETARFQPLSIFKLYFLVSKFAFQNLSLYQIQLVPLHLGEEAASGGG
jgi:hypothetical protein